MPRRTYGPQHRGGYQFPSISSVELRRGDPVKRETVTGGEVTLTPMLGGREQVKWEIRGEWSEGEKRTVVEIDYESDQFAAIGLFAKMVARARRAAG